MVMRDQNKLAKEAWQYIVVDEAHRYFLGYLKFLDEETSSYIQPQIHSAYLISFHNRALVMLIQAKI